VSRTTDYLIEQIRERDQLIQSLLNRQLPDRAQAWSEGWHEHYLEHAKQKADPSHPITQNNPYTEGDN
jgi:hypothetical protein